MLGLEFAEGGFASNEINNAKAGYIPQFAFVIFLIIYFFCLYVDNKEIDKFKFRSLSVVFSVFYIINYIIGASMIVFLQDFISYTGVKNVVIWCAVVAITIFTMIIAAPIEKEIKRKKTTPSNPKSPYDTSHLRRDYNLQNDFYRSYVRQNTSVKIKKLREIAKQKGDPDADIKFNPDIKYCDRQKRTNGEPLERSVREKYFMAVNDFQELGFYWDHETVKMMYEDDKDIESRMNAAKRNREILDENVEELYEKYNKK